MQGKWDFTRNVIIEFPTYDKALEWYNSDLYKPLKELRQKGSEGIHPIAPGPTLQREIGGSSNTRVADCLRESRFVNPESRGS